LEYCQDPSFPCGIIKRYNIYIKSDYYDCDGDVDSDDYDDNNSGDDDKTLIILIL
jgi:hypothetical protein